MTNSIDRNRWAILDAVSRFARKSFLDEPFVPGGGTRLPVSRKVLSYDDYVSLADESLDGWLTAGRLVQQFQRALAKLVGPRSFVFVISGSSANLLAL